MSAYASDAGNAAIIPFINPLAINRPLALTTATGGGAGPILALATIGHVPGSELIITVPANQFTTNPTLPVSYSGDTIDHTLEQHYDFFVMPDGAIAATVRTAVKDTAAPAILSITTGPLLSSVIVTYSKACKVKDITKIASSFSVGTLRTITGLPSGDGTAKHTYPLSGAIANGDALSLVFAAGAIQALTGPELVGATVAALNVFSIFGRFWDMNQGVTTTGGHVTKVVEQVGGDAANCDLVPLGTMPFVTNDATLGGGNSSAGPAPTGGDLHSGTFAVGFTSPYTVIMVGYDDGSATNMYWLFGAGGQADINLNPTYAMYGGTYLMSGVVDTAAPKSIIATFNNATSNIRVSAKTPQASGTTATNPTLNTVIVWNALHTAPYNVNGGFGCLGIVPGAISSTNANAWQDYAAARWPNLSIAA